MKLSWTVPMTMSVPVVLASSVSAKTPTDTDTLRKLRGGVSANTEELIRRRAFEPEALDWVVIHHDSFETGQWADSNWTRGPGTETMEQERASDGSWSVRLRDGLSPYDSSISTSFGGGTDGEYYDAYKITFDFFSKYRHDDGEGLVLEASVDHGATWVEEHSWRKNGTGYSNVWRMNQSYNKTFTDLNPPITHLRFRLDGSNESEMVWIDNVTVSGLPCAPEGCDWMNSPTSSPTVTECPQIQIARSCVGCDSGPGFVECLDRPYEMSFLFLGGNCDDSENGQDGSHFDCTDYGSGTAAIDIGEAAHILVTDSGGNVFFDNTINQGNTFRILAASHDLPPDLKVEVSTSDQKTLLQSFSFHSSCSQNLYLQDIYGALQVVEFENNYQTATCFRKISFEYGVSAPSLPKYQSIKALSARLTTNISGVLQKEDLHTDFDITTSEISLRSSAFKANFCTAGSYQVDMIVSPRNEDCNKEMDSFILTPSLLPTDENKPSSVSLSSKQTCDSSIMINTIRGPDYLDFPNPPSSTPPNEPNIYFWDGECGITFCTDDECNGSKEEVPLPSGSIIVLKEYPMWCTSGRNAGVSLLGNLVLDGWGHALRGIGETGIHLEHGASLKNIEVVGFDTGVFLWAYDELPFVENVLVSSCRIGIFLALHEEEARVSIGNTFTIGNDFGLLYGGKGYVLFEDSPDVPGLVACENSFDTSTGNYVCDSGDGCHQAFVCDSGSGCQNPPQTCEEAGFACT